MFKNPFTLGSLLALLLALLLVMPASATPPQPAGFYGTVMIDGSHAPDGTSVTAWINGTQYAQTDSFTYDGASVYTFDVPGDDSDTPQVVEGGVADDTIVFQIAGQAASQSATWASGSNGELNLTTNAPAPTPTPTSTPLPPTPTPTPMPASSVLYVKADASGANNGSNWTDAYTDLQDALAAAVASDEIWVAAGTYKPTDDADRASSFYLKNGVALYGGFDGTESTREQRNSVANVTILSGDLNGDDNDNVHPDEATRAENSYHVLRGIDIDNTAVLDGFTITGGNANLPGGSSDDSAGMRNDRSSPTLSNLIFTKNSVIAHAGAMGNVSESHPILTNITFSHNVASDSAGAMLNTQGSNPLLTNVTFVDNSAHNNGAGMFNNGSNPTLINVSFSDNSALNDGGGMYNYASNPTLINVSFSDNSAVDDGGGISNVTNSQPTLKNVTFTGNTAHDGGGISNVASNPTLTNVTFSGNFANFGGGMYEYSNSSTLSNVIFTGNSADYGGAMRSATNSSPTLTNVTITGNLATNDGGGIANLGSNPSLINSIVWNNQDSNGTGATSQISGGTASVSYSLVQGGWSGTGNIDADPLFVSPLNPADAPTSAGDVHLQATSPAIDAGDNGAVPTDTLDLDDDGDINEPLPLDLGEQPRFVDSLLVNDTGNGSAPLVDLGAYENPGGQPPTPTPQPTVTPPPDGSVNLTLEPANITTNLAQSFEITIMAHAGSQQVDGVSAYVNFDPAIMEVVSITPSNTFATILQNEFDNTAGHLNFAAGTFFEPFPTGSFAVATITFSALTPADNSLLDFNTSLPRRSDVTFESGNSVLGSMTGNSVTVNNPSTILGSVGLEGRQDAPSPHERWSIPISVTLTLPGESEPQYSFSTTTDEHGDFSLAGIDAGTYNVGVKGLHTLRNVLTIDLAGGENTIDFGLLREGDANNDNVVSILDFSILATTFGKCSGTAGFDERADFDEDTCVTIRDFSLLASNFGEAGDGGTTSAPYRSADNGVQLLIDSPSSTVALEETFNVTVQVGAGEQLIDGVQLALNFDAAYLEVQSISADESLPLELLNQIDNQRGQINFAAGILPAEDGTTSLPSGTISLLHIEFKAKAATESDGTALTFQFSAPQATDITFGGASVLAEHHNATISIGNNPTAITTGEFILASPSPASLLLPLALMLLAGALIVRRKWRNA